MNMHKLFGRLVLGGFLLFLATVLVGFTLLTLDVAKVIHLSGSIPSPLLYTILTSLWLVVIGVIGGTLTDEYL